LLKEKCSDRVISAILRLQPLFEKGFPMQKTAMILASTLLLFSSLSQAGVSINGQTLAPGGYTVDASGNLVRTNDVDAKGNGVGVNVAKGNKNVQQDDNQSQVNAKLCANVFLKKILPQCR
jgi:hypothetical protein